MSGNFAIKGGGGGVGRLMANAILNFHFDFPHPSQVWLLNPTFEKLKFNVFFAFKAFWAFNLVVGTNFAEN